MVSLTNERVRRQSYRYLQECQRASGKPRITWQKYLGTPDHISARPSGGPHGKRIPRGRRRQLWNRRPARHHPPAPVGRDDRCPRPREGPGERLLFHEGVARIRRWVEEFGKRPNDLTLDVAKGNHSALRLDLVEAAGFHYVGSLRPTRNRDLLLRIDLRSCYSRSGIS